MSITTNPFADLRLGGVRFSVHDDGRPVAGARHELGHGKPELVEKIDHIDGLGLFLAQAEPAESQCGDILLGQALALRLERRQQLTAGGNVIGGDGARQGLVLLDGRLGLVGGGLVGHVNWLG